MASVLESVSGQSSLNAALLAGTRTLSQDQEIVFTRYIKLVLPLDGFVFWVKASMVNPGAVINGGVFNGSYIDEKSVITRPAETVSVKGSLHYSTDSRQNEDESLSYNRVIFTSESEIQEFNDVSPESIYIGKIDNIRFAFSTRGKLYKAADIFHYVGDAIFPVMESQIIDDPRFFDASNVVVSNSLPIWLTLNAIMPLYPSFAVPDNKPPLYGAVHVVPGTTTAISAAPFFDATNSQSQFVSERVRITMYGLRNFNAMDFLRYVSDYTLSAGIMGISNMPVVQDEKRTQNELNILAMKKTVQFDVNYYQGTVRNIARDYIKSCVPSFIVT